MKTKLKEITDSTMTELLCNEIVLPSNYFKCFDKHAKTLDVEMNSDSFQKEISNLILDEYNEINSYVNVAIKTIDDVADLTLEAQDAINKNNSSELTKLHIQIKALQQELKNITNNVYKDYLTKVNNKKWLYHKYLTKEAKYKKDAMIILIDISDYDYISNTYNKLIANNVLIFISSYLRKELKSEHIDFEIARYLTNKFILSINEEETEHLETIINNISGVLYNKTLKSNSGIMIKPTFTYSISKVKKDESFHTSIDVLLSSIERIQKEVV